MFFVAIVLLAAVITTSYAQIPHYDYEAIAIDASIWEATQHADNTFAFYDVPSNFSADLEPGTVLKVEEATDLTSYTVPSSLTMSRIMYTTEDAHGKVVPTSGYILWPYALQETYPLVAWAHGSSGYSKHCALSNYRSLQYHFMAPYLLALQGNAVVAPDYAGLGVDKLPSGEKIPHAWLTGSVQANDLANAIIAARSAFPDYLPAEGPFVAMGHSQGGTTAWGFAERQAVKPVAGYKGTISVAPVTSYFKALDASFMDLSAVYSLGVRGMQPRTNAAVTAVFPAFNNSGMTPLAYDRWHNVLERLGGCVPTDAAAFADQSMTPENLAVPGWTDNEFVHKYAKLSEVGDKKFMGPLLVLHGEKDAVVAYDVTKAAAQSRCGYCGSESLEFVGYSEMDHFSTLQASQEKWLTWVRDRLSGKSTEVEGCTFNTVEGFRTDVTFNTSGPNFTVAWANRTTEFWKYVL